MKHPHTKNTSLSNACLQIQTANTADYTPPGPSPQRHFDGRVVLELLELPERAQVRVGVVQRHDEPYGDSRRLLVQVVQERPPVSVSAEGNLGRSMHGNVL